MVVPTRPKILVWTALALLGSGGVGCEGEGRSGADALREARQRYDAAPRVVVDRGHGRVETYAPGLNVIEQRRRVTNWATRDVERIWQPRRRCYDTSTDFLRADYRDQRRGALPREPDIRARLVANGRVIVWLKPAADESPELHGRIRLDRTGRPVRADEASISYPGRVSRPPPGPLCGSG